MKDVFVLAGARDEVYSAMKACDVFAHLSSSEGCPTVVIEALLAGCAVLVTDVPGADELIASGRSGLVVPDEEDAIADGLSRLLLSPGLRDSFRRQLAAAPPVADAAKETAALVEKIEEPVPSGVAPEVTILIPTWNHERFIDRAIASALMQDFPQLEVVVVDDASTDRTETLARSWSSDPRFRYVRNERNLGRVANYRNAVSEHARGEWVLMLDGDDHLVDPGFVRLAWDAIRRRNDPSLVFAQAGHLVHHASGEAPDAEIRPPIEGPERLMEGAAYLQFVYETGFFTHLGTLFNRRAALEHGCYTAEISSSDMDSLLRLALEGRVLVLNTIAGCWVQHGGNASANLPLREIAANVRIFRRIARLAVRRGLTTMPRLDRALTRYEADTLAVLFARTAGASPRTPVVLFRMLTVAASVNPRLLLSIRLASCYVQILRKWAARERARVFSRWPLRRPLRREGGTSG